MILKTFASPINKFPIKNNAGIFENQSDYNVQFDGGSFIYLFSSSFVEGIEAIFVGISSHLYPPPYRETNFIKTHTLP